MFAILEVDVRNGGEMLLERAESDELIKRIELEVSELKSGNQKNLSKQEYQKLLAVRKKSDGSIVTDYDLRLSELTRSLISEVNQKSNIHYFCEETVDKDKTHFRLPGYVLDPIDGTREFATGKDDWCYSLAYLAGPDLADPESKGLIYAPFTGHRAHSDDFKGSGNKIFSRPRPRPWVGLVSQTEWDHGAYDHSSLNQLILAPRGSIALKLSMLASGMCDFVVSRKNKSVWDIAAGSLMCQNRGIYLYNRSGQIKSFSSWELEGPFIWCEKSLIDDLSKVFFNCF